MRTQAKLLYAVVACSVLALVVYLCVVPRGGSKAARLAEEQQMRLQSHAAGPVYGDSKMMMKEGAVLEAEDVTALSSKLQKLRLQRVAMSRDLNEAKQAQGRAVCSYLYLEKSIHPEKFLNIHNMPISNTGGWCYEEGKSSNMEHKMDTGVLPALSQFLAGKTVASFGDGPGDYRKALLQLGKVKKYDAFDGAPYCEETSGGRVKFLDLTGPQYGLELYDWVISLEVAEHIPAKYEDVYVDNLVRHAREGVILSWALPDQDGIHHVNGQPLAHVIAIMQGRGFVLDDAAGASLRQAATFNWLRTNMQVYRRQDPATSDPDEA